MISQIDRPDISPENSKDLFWRVASFLPSSRDIQAISIQVGMLKSVSGDDPLAGNLPKISKFLDESTARELSIIGGFQKYGLETLRLLAKYLTGQLPENKFAELSGKLVFPENEEASKLYATRCARELSEPEKFKLIGFALSPSSSRLAELLYRRVENKEELSLEEKCELYALRLEPEDRIKAQKLFENALSRLKAIRAVGVPTFELERELVRFVIAEVRADHARATSSKLLAELFGLEESRVRELISDPRFGLSAHDLSKREEKRALSGEELKYALDLRVREVLRNFLSLENELHRAAIIPALSTTSALAKLFGEGPQEVEKSLKLLRSADLSYRNKVLELPDLSEKLDALVESVRWEIRSHQSTKQGGLRTDTQLATSLNLSPVSIYHELRKTLNHEELKYRDFVLANQAEQDHYRKSVVEFVRQELKAFDEGRIDRLSTDEELRKLFLIPGGSINQHLRGSSSGLSAAELKFRRYVCRLQEQAGPTSESLREIIIEHGVRSLRPLIAEQNTKLGHGPESASDPDSAGRISRVFYRGMEFGSIQEAACGLVLEQYVPGFKLKPGETFQVEVGRGRFDFLVDGIFVEYHPILLFKKSWNFGSLGSKEEYDRYLKIKDLLPEEDKKRFIERTKDRLLGEYRRQREEHIANSEQYRGSKVLVAGSPEEFYMAVIRQMARDIPSLETFNRDFNRARALVKRANRGPNPPIQPVQIEPVDPEAKRKAA